MSRIINARVSLEELTAEFTAVLRTELDALNVTLDERRLRHLASNLVSHVALREVYDGPVAPDEAITLPYGEGEDSGVHAHPRSNEISTVHDPLGHGESS